MIKIAVCDDEKIEQKILENMIRTLLEKRGLECEIQTFSSGEELLICYEKDRFDLILLDIYMQQLNGIEAGKKIREVDREVDIIFCTSSADFALQSYEVFAIGYILKPFDRQKLDSLLTYFLERKPQLQQKYITVLSRYQEKILQYQDIMYLESSDKVVLYHIHQMDTVTVYEQLGKVEKKLMDDRFMRCHQSYIVNLDYVQKVDQNDFILEGSIRVPIRKREKKKLVEQYHEYIKKSR